MAPRERSAARSFDESPFEEGRTCLAVARAESGVIVDAAAYYRAVADAIERAEHFVLITGWQLDTRVVLRRLPHERPSDHTLAAVLGRACARSPDLVIHVLPWDWNAVYAPDREWSTPEKLREIAEDRIACIWDAAHPPGACQHEKMVLVDGHTAFVGGIDLCDDRWDDRRHLPRDPRRIDLKGKLRGPYHDVQAVVRGDAVPILMEIFADRWARAGGVPLVLTASAAPTTSLGLDLPVAIPEVAIARTRSPDLRDGRPAIHEVRDLLVTVLRRARSLVYAETQYFTSRSLVDALVERMRDASMPVLEVVLLLPRRTEGVLESAAVSAPQRAALHLLARVAAETGHVLGVFCPAAQPSNAPAESADAPPITYVHSKLVIVDDRFLTVGSANLTNRSMGVDSELNLAWAATTREGEDSIRAVRESLLAEHAGLPQEDARAVFGDSPSCVATLVHLATLAEARIVPHSFAEQPDEPAPLEDLLAEIGDPEHVEDLPERARTLMERVARIPKVVAESIARIPHPRAHERRG
jgi:phospholipase D1/2